MEVLYKVPDHLEPFLEDMSPKGTEKIITLLLEWAVHNKMIKMPKMYLELQLDSVVKTLNDIYTENKSNFEQIEERFKELETKIADSRIKAVSNELTTRATIAPIKFEETDELYKEEEVDDQQGGSILDDLVDDLLG